ncbi:hypothetical protein L207DRAFT_528177 [Hyaloscypha variabilis F]|uniref:Uncharacterized protein n=1 Tax=Hyaloscypha variabilis (strain UAMH 11265 / GT02V1 / F) TaxID=1149755 RepID=A0A2J6RSR8_HYAVF|nr:hypothetical protein L207DRAFT_528177 [Hyaloscypha variabilis F]
MNIPYKLQREQLLQNNNNVGMETMQTFNDNKNVSDLATADDQFSEIPNPAMARIFSTDNQFAALHSHATKVQVPPEQTTLFENSSLPNKGLYYGYEAGVIAPMNGFWMSGHSFINPALTPVSPYMMSSENFTSQEASRLQHSPMAGVSSEHLISNHNDFNQNERENLTSPYQDVQAHQELLQKLNFGAAFANIHPSELFPVPPGFQAHAGETKPQYMQSDQIQSHEQQNQKEKQRRAQPKMIGKVVPRAATSAKRQLIRKENHNSNNGGGGDSRSPWPSKNARPSPNQIGTLQNGSKVALDLDTGNWQATFINYDAVNKYLVSIGQPEIMDVVNNHLVSNGLRSIRLIQPADIASPTSTRNISDSALPDDHDQRLTTIAKGVVDNQDGGGVLPSLAPAEELRSKSDIQQAANTTTHNQYDLRDLGNAHSKPGKRKAVSVAEYADLTGEDDMAPITKKRRPNGTGMAKPTSSIQKQSTPNYRLKVPTKNSVAAHLSFEAEHYQSLCFEHSDIVPDPAHHSELSCGSQSSDKHQVKTKALCSGVPNDASKVSLGFDPYANDILGSGSRNDAFEPQSGVNSHRTDILSGSISNEAFENHFDVDSAPVNLWNSGLTSGTFDPPFDLESLPVGLFDSEGHDPFSGEKIVGSSSDTHLSSSSNVNIRNEARSNIGESSYNTHHVPELDADWFEQYDKANGVCESPPSDFTQNPNISFGNTFSQQQTS